MQPNDPELDEQQEQQEPKNPAEPAQPIDDDSLEPPPATHRAGRRYENLVQSERPTVPPPKHSHVRALGGDGASDDTGELPALAVAIPGPGRLPRR